MKKITVVPTNYCSVNYTILSISILVPNNLRCHRTTFRNRHNCRSVNAF